MKRIDEFTKEELYTELAVMMERAECQQDEVDRLYSIVIKLSEKKCSTSSSTSNVNISM